MIRFDSDYMEGCVPQILQRLQKINLEKITGYGEDEICASAAEKIRAACKCPNAQIRFLAGGTQANATVLAGLLGPCNSVIAAYSGHIEAHESGAIEATGHKVIALPGKDGKITAETIEKYVAPFFDGVTDTVPMPQPAAVYISQPTEYGTIYSLAEMEKISAVCKKFSMRLYVDGARLGYALATPKNDVSLPDLARLADVFYIGATKVGGLFGEAVVFPKPNIIPHLVTLIKQRGGLLAKGWLLGLQFDELFSNDLYMQISRNAIERATELEKAFVQKGYKMFVDSPTNQKFVVLDNEKLAELQKSMTFSVWEKPDAAHTVVRFVTSWATTKEQIDAVTKLL